MGKVLVAIVMIVLLLGIGWFVYNDFIVKKDEGRIKELDAQLTQAQSEAKTANDANNALKDEIQKACLDLIAIEAQRMLDSGSDEHQTEVWKEIQNEATKTESAQNNLQGILAWAKGVENLRKEMADGRRWFAKQYESVLGEKKKLEGEIERYRKEIASAKVENTKLNDRLTAIKGELITAQADLKKSQDAYNGLSAELTTAKGNLNKAQGEKSALEAKVKTAEAELKTALGKNIDLARELAAKQETSAVVQKTEKDFTKAFDTAVGKAKTATKVELTKVAMLEYRHYFTRYVAWLAMAGTSDELTKRIGPAEIVRAKLYLGTVLNEYTEEKEYQQAAKFMDRTPKSSPEKIYAVIGGYWSLWQKARSEHQQARLELENQDGAPLDAGSETVLSKK